MLEDHLKGGLLDSKDDELREESKSVQKSNVLSERDFGMLDHLMKMKPKATDMAIEGLIMFKVNDTAEWRSKLSKEQRTNFMEIARKSKKDQREKFLRKKNKIQEERANKLASNLEEKRKKERDRRILKDSLHNKIEKEGLWKTEEEIRGKVEKISGNGKQRDALWLQIRFRQKVLSNTHEDRTVFQLSSGGKGFDTEKLIDNLCRIIEKSNQEKDTSPPQDQDTVNIIILDKETFLKEKEKLMQTVTQPREKSQKKRKQNNTNVAAKKRKVDVQNQQRVPIVTTADDLVGKRICQKFEEEGRDAWFYGTVLSKEQGQNPYFKVRYDDEDIVYRYRLMEDWNNEDIKLVALTEYDLVGTHIEHLYTDANGKDCWYKAFVADVDAESDDVDSPDFFVSYDDESEYYLCPLLDDYENGWVRILS
eukprot:Seg1526.2 transcript_id=Seg1526.2/GoldUCD/mRNA.D3Y31 product=Spindlin-4 protein_id=Seg1526.2/GoldUCD/D3Y31